MKTLPMLVPAMLLLAACTPTATDAASGSMAAMAKANPATASTAASSQLPTTTAQAGSAESPANDARTIDASSASISGAIRDGNRAPPELRVCATPVGGGMPTCIETSPGAREYRIEVAPGRYYLMGWVRTGELTLIAHASQIRCIRAPCPPDELIEVSVAAGEQKIGIDLSGGYVDIPRGWPQRP